VTGHARVGRTASRWAARAGARSRRTAGSSVRRARPPSRPRPAPSGAGCSASAPTPRLQPQRHPRGPAVPAAPVAAVSSAGCPGFGPVPVGALDHPGRDGLEGRGYLAQQAGQVHRAGPVLRIACPGRPPPAATTGRQRGYSRRLALAVLPQHLLGRSGERGVPGQHLVSSAPVAYTSAAGVPITPKPTSGAWYSTGIAKRSLVHLVVQRGDPPAAAASGGHAEGRSAPTRSEPALVVQRSSSTFEGLDPAVRHVHRVRGRPARRRAARPAAARRATGEHAIRFSRTRRSSPGTGPHHQGRSCPRAPRTSSTRHDVRMGQPAHRGSRTRRALGGLRAGGQLRPQDLDRVLRRGPAGPAPARRRPPRRLPS